MALYRGGALCRVLPCSAQLTRNSCPRPPSQQHARASANKTLSCVTTRSISFSMWATCRRQAELSSRRDCRGKASPSHFVSILDRAIGTVLMPTKVQTRPTEGGGLSNVQRTKGGEGARPTEGGGLSNVRGTKGGGAVHKRVGHGSDARRSHLPPPLAASPHRCRPPPGSPTGQNHRQRTVCPSPRPSLPRFAATSPPPAQLAFGVWPCSGAGCVFLPRTGHDQFSCPLRYGVVALFYLDLRSAAPCIYIN